MPKLDANDAPMDAYLTYKDILVMSEEDKPRYLNALGETSASVITMSPGSTAKPFTVAMGLDTGTVKPDDMYFCGGYLMIDGFKIKCHNVDGDGWFTVGQAVEWSCNVCLMQMAEKIGKEFFTKFQNVYNFGLKTGIDLADEARTDQFVSDSTMTDSMLATNSFGQNFDCTMIQLASGFCSLINGGNYYEPHVVKKITSPSGVTLKTIEPRVLKKTVSESTSELIREYTIQVVEGHNGTGFSARPAGYRIGGKTGTAETLPRDNGEYVVSFIGYAPAEDPQICCYVVVDRPNVDGQDDPTFATEIVRSIHAEVLPYMGIYMSEPVTDEERKNLTSWGLDVTYTGDELLEKVGEEGLINHFYLTEGKAVFMQTGMKYLVIIMPMLIAFAVSAVSGHFLIPFLRRVKAGQTERTDGPKSHLSKTGTPNMGGIMILLGLAAASLHSARYPEVIPVLLLDRRIRSCGLYRRLPQGCQKAVRRIKPRAEDGASDCDRPNFRAVCDKDPRDSAGDEDSLPGRKIPGS